LTSLEIGGGLVCAADINLDPVHGGPGPAWKRRAEAGGPWPMIDDSVDRIVASHVMEHIAAGPDRVYVMNEAWRILEPGGIFEIRVPLFLDARNFPTWQAVADPTHVSYWCKESFYYFDGRIVPGADYGISMWTTVSFKIESNGWEGVWIGTPDKQDLKWIARAINYARPQGVA
jgi:SAM-dependent methyltransferase